MTHDTSHKTYKWTKYPIKQVHCNKVVKNKIDRVLFKYSKSNAYFSRYMLYHEPRKKLNDTNSMNTKYKIVL